jgi:L-rhamnose-H+ transport protein
MPDSADSFSTILIGFGFILIAAVAGGAFGLQYRVMRKYTVENTSLISLFFATIVVPLIAAQILLPGWTDAIAEVGWSQNLLVFAFGFGWGLGAITYAYGFNILGMALAAAIIKGITIAIGSGWPLARRWEIVGPEVKTVTLLGLGILLVGTTLAGVAGVWREKELTGKHTHDPDRPEEHLSTIPKQHRGLFLVGLLMVLISGVLSSFANLGYDYARPLEQAMGSDLHWKATLIRWMPMYWGGITALIIFMGGGMIRNGAWRNYFSPGTLRDFLIASSMGVVHFLAQIPYGIGAYYLDKAGRADLGTTVGWGANIGMALIVAASIGFATGEWVGVSRRSVRTLLAGIAVLIFAICILAYANSLQTTQ